MSRLTSDLARHGKELQKADVLTGIGILMKITTELAAALGLAIAVMGGVVALTHGIGVIAAPWIASLVQPAIVSAGKQVLQHYETLNADQRRAVCSALAFGHHSETTSMILVFADLKELASSIFNRKLRGINARHIVRYRLLSFHRLYSFNLCCKYHLHNTVDWFKRL
ncbi:MAG: hypothetical protein U0X75_25935 [Acidobacteriota bacterium]